MRDKPKICLVASGGGHLRQALDIAPAWGLGEVTVISENSILARSMRGKTACHFVTPVILGQARSMGLHQFAVDALRNLFESLAIVRRVRPDVLITTGAGSVFFAALFARLAGARVIVIESLSRSQRLSKSARAVGLFAHARVLQNEALRHLWPEAPVFDPIKMLERAPPVKSALLLATVGGTLPFDRLIGGVAALKRAGAIPERVIVQTSMRGARPEGVECRDEIPFDEMLTLLSEAAIVVCHAGSGSLIPALQVGCRIVAMPRDPARGEHFDHHQDEICTAFTERGLIEVARSIEELGPAIERARRRTSIVATSDTDPLKLHLKRLIEHWFGNPVPAESQSIPLGGPGSHLA